MRSAVTEGRDAMHLNIRANRRFGHIVRGMAVFCVVGAAFPERVTTAGESAGYVVPGTGFIPNNIMGEEDLHPHGFHNRPAGRRIPTMMTPTIVLYEGQPRVALGSGGSIRIRSAILQVLSNLLALRTFLSAMFRLPHC